MQTMLELQITIFSLIAAGFLIRRIHLVPAAFQKQLTDLVLYLVLPCNIVSSFTRQIISDRFWKDLAVIFVISLGIQFFCVFYGKMLFRKQPDSRRRCLEYGIICSNSGFLGNPIAEGVYGAPGLMLASVYLIPQRIMMWSEGLATFSGTFDRRETIRKVATHPCILACVIGIILMLLPVTMPAVITTPIDTIGRCNTALSMMVIGMILSEIDLKTLFDRTLIRYTIHRLVILPLIIYVILTLIHPVSSLVRGVSVLLTAMPAGATTTMLASKYDRDPHFATRMVILSTLCSIPALLVWSTVLT